MLEGGRNESKKEENLSFSFFLSLSGNREQEGRMARKRSHANVNFLGVRKKENLFLHGEFLMFGTRRDTLFLILHQNLRLVPSYLDQVHPPLNLNPIQIQIG